MYIYMSNKQVCILMVLFVMEETVHRRIYMTKDAKSYIQKIPTDRGITRNTKV